MRDRVIIYDQIYNPAVTGAVAANNDVPFATLNAGEHGFIIEMLYLFASWTVMGAPADVAWCKPLIDGQEYPPAPGRFHARAQAQRSMLVPYDDRFAVQTIPLGKISTDPLEDTTLKITPAQRLSFRVRAGPAAGLLATDTALRVIAVGRIADTDSQLMDIYGGSTYDPVGPTSIGDPVTGKMTPQISKRMPITVDNLKYMSGATGQQTPKIFPFWTYGINSAIIPAVPEFEWTYQNPAHVLNEFEELNFDWTRITDRALWIRYLGAYILAGSGNVWIHQPPLRRPGHLNQFFGWVVNAAYPNLLPGGGALGTGAAGMHKGPLDLAEVQPRILAFNNLTQVRVAADPGTTIAAGDLEIQMRGTDIQF